MPTPSPPLLEVARRFAAFAQNEAAGVSPLYSELARAVTKDEEVLALASLAPPGQPNPNLLFAAVQFLLLRGTKHPLAQFYRSTTSRPRDPSAAFPEFKSFCRENHTAIQRILGGRRVQTNEVSRCTCLLPGFATMQRRDRGRPWFLVDIGASAGLNLIWDRYSYDFGPERKWGPRSAGLRLACEPRGERSLPLPERAFDIRRRVGIDIAPVDVEDPVERQWLEALVWPEQRERVRRLRKGIKILREEPPVMVKGDASELVPRLLEGVPPGLTRCLFSSFTLNQFSSEARESLTAGLIRQGRSETVYLLTLGGSGPRDAELRLIVYRKGEPKVERLARCAPHGGWIEWLVG